LPGTCGPTRRSRESPCLQDPPDFSRRVHMNPPETPPGVLRQGVHQKAVHRVRPLHDVLGEQRVGRLDERLDDLGALNQDDGHGIPAAPAPLLHADLLQGADDGADPWYWCMIVRHSASVRFSRRTASKSSFRRTQSSTNAHRSTWRTEHLDTDATARRSRRHTCSAQA
jgi:hypothetical protein